METKDGIIAAIAAAIGSLITKFFDFIIKRRESGSEVNLKNVKFVIDQYKEMATTVKAVGELLQDRMDILQEEHAACRAENAMLKSSSEQQEVRIKSLEIEVADLRHRLNDGSRDGHGTS